MPLLYREVPNTSKKSVISQGVKPEASDVIEHWREGLSSASQNATVPLHADCRLANESMSTIKNQIAELSRGTDEVLPEDGLAEKLKKGPEKTLRDLIARRCHPSRA